MSRFRWVACQLDELEKCTKRRKTLDEILGHLPETLEASRISPADVSDTVKLLLWLAFARQPLDIDHLAIIVEFNLDKKVFNSDAKLASPMDILKICSSLVTGIGDNTVQLAHASVKQYILKKKRIIQSKIALDPSIGDAFIGQCCLNYLLQTRELESHRNPFGLPRVIYASEGYKQTLLMYSAKYWSQHMLAAGLDMCTIEQIKELFEVTNISFKNWVEVYNDGVLFLGTRMNNKSPLQCAAFHGLKPIVEWLLPSVMRDHEGIHSVNDSEQVENLGLDRGIRYNSMLLEYGDALHAASHIGHKEIVQLLLERGTDANSQGSGKFDGNALQAASNSGNKKIVQLLLERGADVNAQGGQHGNALQAASDSGHKGIVQLLLERGADVNAQGGKYRNALLAASHSGHKDIVQLLLERGAVVNVQEEYYGNALQVASNSGNKEIVQLLLERGANVNAQGGYYGNALEAASLHGHKSIVQLLLEKGADVNAQGEKYGNALQAASDSGHKDIVWLLLERVADVNAQGGEYGNYLQAASGSSHKDIVQLLLESGLIADVNAHVEYI